MVDTRNCHPGDQWFYRVFDKNWTPSNSSYYYKLQHDKRGNPSTLRRFFKEHDDLNTYCGTYKILYQTERLGDMFLIMQRIENEVLDNFPYIGDDRTTDQVGDTFVAKFYPTGFGRLELTAPSEITARTIIEEYEKKNR